MQITYIVLLTAVFVLVVSSVTVAEAYTVDPALVQTVQGYAAEMQYGAEHVDRWNRVLDAFGVISHTSSMTAEQAQQMADKFSAKRWNPIVAALTALEQSQQQQQDPQVVEAPIQYRVDTTLVQTVQGYAAETHYGAEHVDRWNRVLDAFGVISHTSSMTAAEAQEMADKFSAKRWNPIVEALTALEEAKKQDQQQSQQQGALENPQYTPQQDQLPSTQQDQLPSTQQDQQVCSGNEFNPPQACKDYLTGRFTDARDNVMSIIDQMEQLVDQAEAQKKQDPAKYTEFVNLWNRYKSWNFYGIDAQLGNIEYGENNIANGRWHDIIGAVKKLEYATTYFPIWLDRLESKLAEFAPDTTLDLCPAELPTDKAKRQFVNNTSNSLEDRVCAYHDITYYSDYHKGFVKRVLLTLGIYPEADDIKTISVVEAWELAWKFDGSQTRQHPDYEDFEHDKIQGNLWTDIAKELSRLASTGHDVDYYPANP